MAIVANTGISLKDAISYSFDVYDLIIFGWGEDFQGGFPRDAYPAFTEPGLSDSIAGIAIGPKSDVDRCWITINPGKTVNATNQPWALTREVSIGNPLLFEQPTKKAAPLSTFPNYEILPMQTLAQSLGLAYIVPQALVSPTRVETTMLPLNYQKADFTNVDVLVDMIGKITEPMLHLQLILNRNITVGTKRSTSREGNYTNVIGGINEDEVAIRMLPVFGRKQINVQVRAEHLTDPTATVTVRCAVLRSLGANIVVQEETVGQKTADALGGCSFAFHLCDLAADYLIIYASSSVAAPAPGARVTGYSVTSTD